jgi:hypothetical protein
MPLIILGILIVGGIVAVMIFRSKSTANDRRRQEENSKR